MAVLGHVWAIEGSGDSMMGASPVLGRFCSGAVGVDGSWVGDETGLEETDRDDTGVAHVGCGNGGTRGVLEERRPNKGWG